MLINAEPTKVLFKYGRASEDVLLFCQNDFIREKTICYFFMNAT